MSKHNKKEKNRKNRTALAKENKKNRRDNNAGFFQKTSDFNENKLTILQQKHYNNLDEFGKFYFRDLYCHNRKLCQELYLSWWDGDISQGSLKK